MMQHNYSGASSNISSLQADGPQLTSTNMVKAVQRLNLISTHMWNNNIVKDSALK